MSYNEFNNNRINEGWIGDALKSASGVFKNFLTNIGAPFKNLVNDFKKGMKIGELKTKISATMDTSLKTATDAINKAKDEQEINNIKDSFNKEIDSKITEFGKELSIIKESKIYEGAGQDALIGGSIIFGMFKDAYQKRKAEFDKAFAAAKDLNAKKTTAINALKSTINDFKNKIKDDTAITELIKKYKTDHKITDAGNANGITLNWGDVEIELSKSETQGFMKVIKSNSKKLLANDLIKYNGPIKKGQKVTFTDVTRNGKVVLSKYDTGNFEKIIMNGKEIEGTEIHSDSQQENDQAEELHQELGKIKNDKDKMKKINDFVKNIDDKNKMDQISKILST